MITANPFSLWKKYKRLENGGIPLLKLRAHIAVWIMDYKAHH